MWCCEGCLGKVDKLKVCYLMYEDPWVAGKPTDNYEFEDLSRLTPAIFRIAGVLVEETNKAVKLAEVRLAEDNPEMNELFPHPSYRVVAVISKRSIFKRVDFDVPDGRDGVIEK